MLLEHQTSQFEQSNQPLNSREGHHRALYEDAYNLPRPTDRSTNNANAMECFVAAQQGNQQQNTDINADWIRANFNGQQRQQLLDLFRDHHIRGIRLGPAGADGNRPVTINFDQQMNIPGVGDFQALSGTLQTTQNGFRITNPRADGQRISLGGVNVTQLEYNNTWLCHFYANNVIPIPGQSDLCGTIRRALGALR